MQTSLPSLPTARRRLTRTTLALAATAVLSLGAVAAPAHAERNDACANAAAQFHARMNLARSWIGAADRLADAGFEAESQAATDTANKFLDLADESLSMMGAAC